MPALHEATASRSRSTQASPPGPPPGAGTPRLGRVPLLQAPAITPRMARRTSDGQLSTQSGKPRAHLPEPHAVAGFVWNELSALDRLPATHGCSQHSRPAPQHSVGPPSSKQPCCSSPPDRRRSHSHSPRAQGSSLQVIRPVSRCHRTRCPGMPLMSSTIPLKRVPIWTVILLNSYVPRTLLRVGAQHRRKGTK